MFFQRNCWTQEKAPPTNLYLISNREGGHCIWRRYGENSKVYPEKL